MTKKDELRRDPQKRITLSALAIQQAISIQENNDEWKDLPLRLYIEGKGCSGFYYGVSFDARREDDLIFPQYWEDHRVYLVVDKETYSFVYGSVIEWEDSEQGKGFIVQNPQHKNFRGKFFKRDRWKKMILEVEEPS